MDNDVKWIMIGFALIVSAMFGGAALITYNQSQCRIAYAQSDKTAEEISKVCK